MPIDAKNLTTSSECVSELKRHLIEETQYPINSGWWSNGPPLLLFAFAFTHPFSIRVWQALSSADEARPLMLIVDIPVKLAAS